MKRHVFGMGPRNFQIVSLFLLTLILCMMMISIDSQKINGKIGKDQNRDVCGMRCPAGHQLLPRIGFKATFNGCGPSGEFNNISDKIGFTNCCNEHDICYTDCSKTKEACDSEFAECLNGHCSTKSHKEEEECSNIAGVFQLGVTFFGCDSYTTSLEEACECKPNKDEL